MPDNAAEARAANSFGPTQQERCGGRPVVEDGLLPAILVVEVGREPVAALHHLARRFRVEAFVGVGDGRAAQTDEERQP